MSTPHENGVETLKGVIYPWQCDQMGHMSTRFYATFFEDASYHFAARLGCDPRADAAAKRGWADIRQEIEYLGELNQGDLIIVRTRPVNVGNTSMTFVHEIILVPEMTVCAKATCTAVRFDLAARRATPVEDTIRGTLAAWIAGEPPA